MTEIIKASETRDLVAAATAALGFTPTESLVVMCLRGDNHRVGLVMRADLDALSDPRGFAPAVAHIKAQADAVILLVFTDDVAARRRGYAHATGALLGTRIPVQEALWVSTSAYGSLTCPEPRCCPIDGWPLADVEASLVRAETTLRGVSVAPTRAALLPAPATPAARREAEAARLAWIAEHGRIARTGDPVADEARAARALDAWITPVVTGRDAQADPADLGRIAAVVSDIAWRDLVIAFVVTRGEVDTLAEATDGAFDGMLVTAEGAEPLRPVAATISAEVALLLRTAAHTAGAPAAHAYATAGMLAWWSGDGATADLAADAAAEADPTVTLAGVVRLLLTSGRPPAWTTTTN